MAEHLSPKGAGETVTRRWPVPVADGDSVSSVVTSATGVTVDSETTDGDELVLVLSGGSAGSTGSITATVTTGLGDTLVIQFYVPIVAPDATGLTVRDVCEFALRKVYGKDETPDATAMADAVERLDNMLRSWAATGAEVGATFPLSEGLVIYCKPEFEGAIKNNLIVQLADLYDLPIGGMVMENARHGLQLVKTANRPVAQVEYY